MTRPTDEQIAALLRDAEHLAIEAQALVPGKTVRDKFSRLVDFNERAKAFRRAADAFATASVAS
jgi:hypothetical protein